MLVSVRSLVSTSSIIMYLPDQSASNRAIQPQLAVLVSETTIINTNETTISSTESGVTISSTESGVTISSAHREKSNCDGHNRQLRHYLDIKRSGL